MAISKREQHEATAGIQTGGSPNRSLALDIVGAVGVSLIVFGAGILLAQVAVSTYLRIF